MLLFYALTTTSFIILNIPTLQYIPQKSKLIVLPIKNNTKEPTFQGTLILKHTPKGARAGKFRIRHDEKEDCRAPGEFTEL